MNPALLQWIDQMGDQDQVVAYYAYQCLLEEALRAGAPGQEAKQAALAEVLGKALVARAEPKTGGGRPGSFESNPFLTAVAARTAAYEHPAQVRRNLARLLGYLPHEAVVPYLREALDDLEARETARQSLELHPSDNATAALVQALDSAGAVFCAGVVNSLAKRRGPEAAAAVRRAAGDPQPEVRIAALYALAETPDASHDAILAKMTEASSPEEAAAAHVARARLADTLWRSGGRAAAERIYRSILESGAGEPQKVAARLALGG
ncbi:MAG: hypothetical protein KIT09_07705 [Bryobacteraceae bacterium]|nr:hypothetical protein [Bryobacteraceae bacterium]